MPTNKYYYDYYWDIKFEVPSRELVFRPYNIIRFVKNCDYFNGFIPSYSLTVNIDDKYLELLRSFDKELIVTIKQYKYYGISREYLDNKEIVLEDVFIPFYDKNTIPDISNSTKSVSSDFTDMSNSYEPNSLTAEMGSKIKINLLRKSDLLMKKFIHNYVLGSTDKPITPADAVSLIIDQNPYITKFLMDEPDNNTQYPDLIVKADELKNAIKQVQIDYGIYAKGLLLFIDDGVLYILNKLNPEHAARDKEITSIIINLDERVERFNPIDCSTINEEDKYIYYQRTAKLAIQDNESIEGETVGDKFVYSNFSSVINAGFNTTSGTKFVSPLQSVDRPAYTNVNTGTKKIVDYDMINNGYNMSSYVYETAMGTPVSFLLESVNCSDFTPNKRVKLILQNPTSYKLYSGVYNISRCQFIYETSGKTSERYHTYGHCIVTLCNKQDGLNKDYKPNKALEGK